MFAQIRSIFGIAALVAVAAIPVALTAQTATKSDNNSAAPVSPLKWDIFAGYSYLDPHGQIAGTTSGASGNGYGQLKSGGIMSVTRYFDRHLGLEVLGDTHTQSEDRPVGSNGASYNSKEEFAGASAGFTYRIPTSYFTPFFHVLFGAERIGSTYQKDTWSPAYTAGGGLDINTRLIDHRLGIRVAQVDYQHFDSSTSGINAARLSTGVVVHLGKRAVTSVTLACSANPESVFPGEPVLLTASATNLDAKLKAKYSWSGPGLGAMGNDPTTMVNTAPLVPGTYTVQCGVKEGTKAWESAQSSTSFSVKAFEKPTVSCSASPALIKPGDSSTITATGVSPQNLPLTYDYSAASGSVSGSGTTATYDSSGASTGTVEITCNVSDDKGQTASAKTSVTINAPRPLPQAHTTALCSIPFDRDQLRPTRVDNEAKACLDEVALNLQKNSDARAVLVGESSAGEKAINTNPRKHRNAGVVDFAAQRAVNAKDYLVKEKGIDASRINTATGTEDGKKVANYFVPSGASFDAEVPGTVPVNEKAVIPQKRKPLPVRHQKKSS